MEFGESVRELLERDGSLSIRRKLNGEVGFTITLQVGERTTTHLSETVSMDAMQEKPDLMTAVMVNSLWDKVKKLHPLR